MASNDDDHVTDHVTNVYEDDDTEDEDHLTLPNQTVEEDDVDLIDEDEEEEEEDDSTSSGVGDVTIAVPGDTANVITTPTTAVNVVTVSPLPRSNVITSEHKKTVPLDESRRLFQRLWTDEDEIELLRGFLEYNNQRVANNPFHHHHHHDTTAFYDQIKDKLQLDFNKNQLVEKLRRLKKKYRNVLSKISSGKEYVFKSAHDQMTFDISSKIWSNEGAAVVSTPVRFDDEETNNPNTNANANLNVGFNLNEQNGCLNSFEKKSARSRKRSRSGGVKVEEKVNQPEIGVVSNDLSSVPNLVEETVKSCLLPLFKELLEGRGSFRGFGLGGMNLDPFSLSLGGLMNMPVGDVTDEKWRKQHILELEVCSKRLELVQEQVKSRLEELKATRR